MSGINVANFVLPEKAQQLAARLIADQIQFSFVTDACGTMTISYPEPVPSTEAEPA